MSSGSTPVKGKNDFESQPEDDQVKGNGERILFL